MPAEGGEALSKVNPRDGHAADVGQVAKHGTPLQRRKKGEFSKVKRRNKEEAKEIAKHGLSESKENAE